METSELRGWLNERNSEIFSRAAFAKRTILKESKKRRDLRRYYYAKQASLVYGIKTGKYLSWGYGTMQSEYDEYFGEINASNQPHGLGVKFYTDGSVYHGHWSNGNQHTAEGGVWIRSNGLIYEGGWVAGKKHGYGKLSYPETEGQKVSYEGQFANGLEHGQGILTYTDKSIHKGRFRFGKRDGPGVYMDAFGQSVRGNFKDKPTAAYIDHSPPKVYEDEIPAKSLNNPGSLLELSIRALAYHGTYIPRVPAMHPRRLQQKIDKFESDSALSHNFDSMKQLLAMDFYKALNDVAPVHMKQKKDTEFQSALSRGSFVFSREKQVVFNSSRVSEADMEALLFFQGGNDTLEELSLVGCGLRSGAVEALGRQIKLWPKLRSLDLSFNKLGAVNVILTGYTRCLQTLRLRGCGLNNFDMAILTKLLLDETVQLEELDLSFNSVGIDGAQHLGKALQSPKCMLNRLHLRSSEICQAGAEYLVLALAGNQKLEILNVADNNIQPATIVDIAARLKGSYTELSASFAPEEIHLPRRYRFVAS